MPLPHLTREPIYKGERVGRTDSSVYLCKCGELAQYQGRLKGGGPGDDLYLCETHVSDAINNQHIRKAWMLPEYRRHLHRLDRWESQINAPRQPDMFQSNQPEGESK